MNKCGCLNTICYSTWNKYNFISTAVILVYQPVFATLYGYTVIFWRFNLEHLPQLHRKIISKKPPDISEIKQLLKTTFVDILNLLRQGESPIKPQQQILSRTSEYINWETLYTLMYTVVCSCLQKCVCLTIWQINTIEGNIWIVLPQLLAYTFIRVFNYVIAFCLLSVFRCY